MSGTSIAEKIQSNFSKALAVLIPNKRLATEQLGTASPFDLHTFDAAQKRFVRWAADPAAASGASLQLAKGATEVRYFCAWNNRGFCVVVFFTLLLFMS